MSLTANYVPIDLPSAPTRYTDPRAHELRERYLATFGGDEIPVPVESIAEDLLGLRIEEDDLGECSGMLIPSERLILVNASEAMSGDTPTRRHRFTIAHELGHWICHASELRAAPTYCRSQDVSQDTDRTLEREANVFGAELLMPRRRCARRGRRSPTATEWRHGSGCRGWPRTRPMSALFGPRAHGKPSSPLASAYLVLPHSGGSQLWPRGPSDVSTPATVSRAKRASRPRLQMRLHFEGPRTRGIDLLERLLTTGEQHDGELSAADANDALEGLEHLELPWLVGGMIEGGEQFARQVHAEMGRGLQEVVQNAQDQNARNIRFGWRVRQGYGELLIAHDGDPVALHDVVYMAYPLVSGSRRDPDRIGRFGIGLKTLNQLGDRLEVHCPPLSFEIRNGRVQRVPQIRKLKGFWNPEPERRFLCCGSSRASISPSSEHGFAIGTPNRCCSFGTCGA